MTTVLLGSAALVLMFAVSPGLAACTDEDGDGFYAESGCGSEQDCNDRDEHVFPGAPQRCDGVNNDCRDPSWPEPAGLPDRDDDGIDDDCDPFPDAALRVWATAPEFVLAGSSVRVTYRLEDGEEVLRDDLEGVRFRLRIDGSAVFGGQTEHGILLEGAGTQQALVEFVDGLVTLEIEDDVAERVRLLGEDTEHMGVMLLTDVFKDFEDDDGGFDVSSRPGFNAAWDYGVPSYGPPSAYSGTRLWATAINRVYPPTVWTQLRSPSFRLPATRGSSLVFKSWIDVDLDDEGTVLMEVPELLPPGARVFFGELRGRTDQYRTKVYDLSYYAGSEVRIVFRFTSNNGGPRGAGWYVDDFELRGWGRRAIDFLDRLSDDDGDGVGNAEELSLGTNPVDADTDDDGVPDGLDNCSLVPNPDQADVVRPNGVGDECDDPDEDEVPDARDNCPDTANADQLDPDRDGPGSACDNCPDLWNRDQEDGDGDGTGDVCSVDTGTPAEPSVPFELPFRVADAAFDPVRPYVYLAHAQGRSVYVLNLESGLLERRFDLGAPVRKLALTADGARLFAALETEDEDAPAGFEPPPGFVAGFDLEQTVRDRYFAIGIPPRDMVATTTGRVVVAPSGSQSVQVYDATTGEQTGMLGISTVTGLALHPSESRVYLSPSRFRLARVDLLDDGTLVEHVAVFLSDDVTSRYWMSPSGDYVITAGGRIGLTGESPETDLRLLEHGLTGSPCDVLFVPSRPLFHVTEGTALRSYNASSLLAVGEQELSGGECHLGSFADRMYVVQDLDEGARIVVMDFPFPEAPANEAPRARIEARPEHGSLGTEFVLDASSSTDDTDPPGSLLFRWDVDNDGIWEGLPGPDPTHGVRYSTPGDKIVRVQVLDSLRAPGTIAQTLRVELPDPGEVPVNWPPYRLGGSVSDLELDPIRPRVYATDSILRFIDLETGAAVREFRFGSSPFLRRVTRLALTPDGSRMYAILSHPRPTEPSFVAGFDLATDLLDVEFEVTPGAFDIAAASNGHVVVSTTDAIRVYESPSGTLTSSIETGAGELSLALHPGGEILYGASSPDGSVHRFDLDDAGGISIPWAPVSVPANGGRIWMSPAGDVLVSSGGQVLAVGDSAATDLALVATLSPGAGLERARWDPGTGTLFLAVGQTLLIHDSGHYGLIKAWTFDDPVEDVVLSGDRLYVVVRSGSVRRLEIRALDDDADGVAAYRDNCEDTPNPEQHDSDTDGFGDPCDNCPAVANPGQEEQHDFDGVGVACDNCPTTANPDQTNGDGDAFGDACDRCPETASDDNRDRDGDGVGDVCDPCPFDRFDDRDGDGLCDGVDPCDLDPDNDADGDGRCADRDNCPDVANPSQADTDRDSLGDACDPCPTDARNDRDGDGLCAEDDNCAGVANVAQDDADGDGVGDACDRCPDLANPDQGELLACSSVTQDGGQCLEARADPLGEGPVDLSITQRVAGAPHTLTFEIASAHGGTFAFFLNGAPMVETQGLPHDLTCGVTPQVARVKDADRIRDAWRVSGPNTVRVVQESPGARVEWVRVHLESADRENTVCIYDDDGGECEWPSPPLLGCVTASPYVVVDASADVSGDYTTDVSRVTLPAIRLESPVLVDIETLQDGEYRLCTSELAASPRLYGVNDSGDFFAVDHGDGHGTWIRTLPFGALDAVYDPASDRTYVQYVVRSLSDEIDPRSGRTVGAIRVSRVNVAWDALAYARGIPYGVVTRPPFEDAHLARLDPWLWDPEDIGSTGVDRIVGLAWNSDAEVMYGVTIEEGRSRLVTVDLDTAEVTSVGGIGFEPSSLAAGPEGMLFAGGADGSLYRVDPATAEAVRVGDTGFVDVTGLFMVDDTPPWSDCRSFVKEGEEALALNGAACGPPEAVARAAGVVECDSPLGAAVTLDGSASTDPNSSPGTNDDIEIFDWFVAYGTPEQQLLGSGQSIEATLPLGASRVTLHVIDSFGQDDLDDVTVEIVDTTPPELDLMLRPSTLWPPDHRLRRVLATVEATDRCGPTVVALTSVSSDEADDAPGGGDGRTTGDIRGVDLGGPDFEFRLRAERRGTGSGRTYTVVYRATDPSGNVTETTADAVVPLGGPALPSRNP